jgi:translation initiation factor 2 beta subunit (eIF-2beta)/eIF-5
MTKNIIAISILLFGFTAFADGMPEGAIQIGPTIITLNKKNAPEEEKQLIQKYISYFKSCVITENTDTSSYVRCDNYDQAILSGLSAYDALTVLLENGFTKAKSTKVIFAKKRLTQLSVDR